MEIRDRKTFEEVFSAKKALVFKNSTRCSISRSARMQFEQFALSCEDDIKLYMVEVIENGKLSREIEEKTHIRHESPQAILLEGGNPMWSAAHYGITCEAIEKAILSK